MESINYLYKRNASGEPILWGIEKYGLNLIKVVHGIVGKKLHEEIIPYTMKSLDAEIESRLKAKRKEGYRYVHELHDNAPNEINDFSTLIAYLNAYLPKYNTTDEGLILPMLAKTLTDNKPFDKFGYMIGQWKINGVRCIIGIERNYGDLFKPYKVTYQSREGTTWVLPDMDDYILSIISDELLEIMLEEHVHLDGELYIPGLTVNEINSAVKNPNNPWYHNIQYWIYDLCYEDSITLKRNEYLYKSLNNYVFDFEDKMEHFCNEKRIVVLPSYDVHNFEEAVKFRDKFIKLGFEGLILRNPNSEYLFGKRSVNGMYKFKNKDDGYFKIISIAKDKRGLPIFTLKNDINDETFEVTLNNTQEYQQAIINNIDNYIGKLMTVEFRERSGVKKVPFHAKGVRII